MHELYESLVRGPRPPRVFYDVGASYGLHSLRLLVHGTRVVSFEPNDACHPFFAACCAANRLRADLRPRRGRRRLRSRRAQDSRRPELARNHPASVARSWDGDVAVASRRVHQVTLDEVMKNDQLAPDVIKIDTEGSELSVLAGAQAILERTRPLVLLESWPESPERVVLFELMASYGYRLHALRFAVRPSPALTLAAFVDSPATNFAAHPTARRPS